MSEIKTADHICLVFNSNARAALGEFGERGKAAILVN